jgi:hypothetical protein
LRLAAATHLNRCYSRSVGSAVFEFEGSAFGVAAFGGVPSSTAFFPSIGGTTHEAQNLDEAFENGWTLSALSR